MATRTRMALAAFSVLLARDASLGADEGATPLTPAEHRRAPEQTFLTFPEWFLVFSPAEYAAFVKTRAPSEFPFFDHVVQFWSAYRSIWQATQAYPFNSEYHVMIAVIGSSTSVEYGLRLAYETLIGRLSELDGGALATDEDKLAAEVAQEYVDFIRVEPWYKFDFARALSRLWRLGLWGTHPLRRFERKYALTTEWGSKALYAVVIKAATQASYGEAAPTTLAVVEPLPPGIETEIPQLKLLNVLPNGAALVQLPRYEAFTRCAAALAEHGVRFNEIAGNRGPILVSALVPSAWAPAAEQRLLFSQPILTQPHRKRAAIVTPVASLAELLRTLRREGHELEHVYDY